MKISKSVISKFFQISAVIIFVWIVSSLAIQQMTSEEFREIIDKFGILGPLVVIAYVILSHIFAPVVAMPVLLASVAVFGIYEAMFYNYIGGVISSVINFYIARKFGRGVILRLVGSKGMKEIDEFTEKSGTRILILSRLFGFAFFEIVSYAYGLTIIDFKKYFFITSVFSAIPVLAFAVVFQNVDFSTVKGIFIWAGVLVFTGIAFSYVFKKYLLKRRG
ncbi:MAG: hypothetical protein A3B96_03800 [Candidatus Spechtbacteria bacterium RIFCSPHIGHO2_02_FULL_43_15b]|uniref:TVP38/TMEM64 family membrane protein n=1 Tax=Candidatus Spechtbacteria bacterium RIFCSPHIGHO2_01_FULL_43_30 TaxID=1802158 RepID=A0A1G2H9N5_9BACT|nr:MAG: hypothetical protein A2827_03320 [Candidatus Spechtbacteria bacterium RIFCSPHIGHO2_01_FULL_43_30]OGZ59134.1 MAG: hypothetical protein A3B96_03800 [Candidatus Spechtbacteria bacterium RIFCSPHIGHO2_02_FULL_43_15b]